MAEEISMRAIGLSFLLFELLNTVYCNPAIPNLNGHCYLRPQDINIGLIIPITGGGYYIDDTKGSEACDIENVSPWRVQYVEAFKFALDEVNNSTTILPNISLGYIIMDTCYRDLTALSRSLYFIPDKDTVPVKTEQAYVKDCGNEVEFYSATGIVGPSSSRDAVMFAPLMGLFQIPMLGTYTTSDELSDKSR